MNNISVQGNITAKMAFEGLSYCSTIVWESVTNPWMAFMCVVRKEWACAIAEEFESKLGEWLGDDESVECYGDIVMKVLAPCYQPYILFLHDSGNETDSYEEEWERLGLILKEKTADWIYLDI